MSTSRPARPSAGVSTQVGGRANTVLAIGTSLIGWSFPPSSISTALTQPLPFGESISTHQKLVLPCSVICSPAHCASAV